MVTQSLKTARDIKFSKTNGSRRKKPMATASKTAAAAPDTNHSANALDSGFETCSSPEMEQSSAHDVPTCGSTTVEEVSCMDNPNNCDDCSFKYGGCSSCMEEGAFEDFGLQSAESPMDIFDSDISLEFLDTVLDICGDGVLTEGQNLQCFANEGEGYLTNEDLANLSEALLTCTNRYVNAPFLVPGSSDMYVDNLGTHSGDSIMQAVQGFPPTKSIEHIGLFEGDVSLYPAGALGHGKQNTLDDPPIQCNADLKVCDESSFPSRVFTGPSCFAENVNIKSWNVEYCDILYDDPVWGFRRTVSRF